MSYPVNLKIKGLQIPVHLGVGEEEREEAQMVTVDVEIHYPTPPETLNDDDGDYFCYDTLCQQLIGKASEKPVKLLEFLAGELFALIRATAPSPARISLSVRKPLPQSLVGYVVDSACITISDC